MFQTFNRCALFKPLRTEAIAQDYSHGAMVAGISWVFEKKKRLCLWAPRFHRERGLGLKSKAPVSRLL